MEFGIQLANIEPPRFRAMAQTMEGLGYHLVCFPDHIVMEGPEKQYDPHGLAYDMIVIAAAVIEATKKIQVGHLVLCNLFRHPVITAQSLTTLDHLSGGRLLAGLGSGWTETEFEMTGILFPPITERLRMLDEALTVIRSLWANERTTFDGEFYKLKDAILWPKPLQKPRPPIIVGGGGKGLLRIAAKHADYLNLIPGAGKAGHISLSEVKRFNDEVYREKVDFVRAETTRNGRSADAVKISSFVFITMLTDSRDATRKTAEQMAQAFGQTSEELLQSPMILIGTPEDCIVELKRRVKSWGLSQVIFSGQGMDEAAIRNLWEKVLVHV